LSEFGTKGRYTTVRTALTDRPTWLVGVGWFLVLSVAAVLTAQTAMYIALNGLVAVRPPLSTFQTGLRVFLALGALIPLFIRRDVLERVTLIIGAAAASSTALYGLGVRSSFLSAFRLLSHLAVYLLAVVVAWRLVSAAFRQLTIQR